MPKSRHSERRDTFTSQHKSEYNSGGQSPVPKPSAHLDRSGDDGGDTSDIFDHSPSGAIQFSNFEQVDDGSNGDGDGGGRGGRGAPQAVSSKPAKVIQPVELDSLSIRSTRFVFIL